MADRWKTLSEIAAELRISHETARRAILDGLISAKQVRGPGSAWRVDSKSYREYLGKSAKTRDAADVQQDETINKTG